VRGGRGLLLWGVAGAGAAAAALGLALFGVPLDGIEVCATRRFTGLACPGCGLTRAFAALARGDWAAAWSFHPFALLLAAQGGAAWLASGWRLLRGLALEVPSRLLTAALVGNGAGMLALWLGRAATGTLP
jgi:hypothetical protein